MMLLDPQKLATCICGYRKHIVWNGKGGFGTSGTPRAEAFSILILHGWHAMKWGFANPCPFMHSVSLVEADRALNFVRTTHYVPSQSTSPQDSVHDSSAHSASASLLEDT